MADIGGDVPSALDVEAEDLGVEGVAGLLVVALGGAVGEGLGDVASAGEPVFWERSVPVAGTIWRPCEAALTL